MLFLLCTVLFLVNLADGRHARQMDDAAYSIYHDRLLAERYLLQFQQDLHRLSQAAPAQSDRVLAHTALLDQAYRKTAMTSEETVLLDRLMTEMKQLSVLRQRAGQDAAMLMFGQCEETLERLSALQVKEAGQELRKIRTAMNSLSSASMLEMALLVVAGLLLQALVFAARPLFMKPSAESLQLN